MPQEELAHITGIGRAHISRIENGKVELPQIETRARIAAALGVSDAEIMRDADLAPPLRVINDARLLYDDSRGLTETARALIASFTPEQRLALLRLIEAASHLDDTPVDDAERKEM